MGYEAKVLADSVSSVAGIRLITVQVTFPRFILAELNTHRLLSRNSASSRAIPPEKIIEQVLTDPFIPETFNRRVKGMGVGEDLRGADQDEALDAWITGRDEAVRSATVLVDLDVDKSRVNRLLEPFMWHTAIVTATEWDNFFALRDHPAAQPEFQKLARLMRETMMASEPTEIKPGEWHLPLVGELEPEELGPNNNYDEKYWARVSAGRCARVSFDRHEEYEISGDSYKRCTEKLEKNGHLSPLEHPAMVPLDGAHLFSGNLRGWTQLRKMIPYESNLVGHLEGIASWEDEVDSEEVK